MNRKLVGSLGLLVVWGALVYTFGVAAAVLCTAAVVFTGAVILAAFFLPATSPLCARSFIMMFLQWSNEFGDSVTPPKYTVMSEVMGYQKTKLMTIACELGVPDALGEDDRRSAGDLAHSLRWSSPSAGGDSASPQSPTADQVKLLYRVLRALASTGVFQLHADRTFSHTPTSLVLRADSPSSVQAYVVAHGRINYPAWEHLLALVRGSGQNPLVASTGLEYYEYLRLDPQGDRLLQRKMEAIGKITNAGLLHSVDWTALLAPCATSAGPATLVDVGGGRGEFLRQLLRSGAGRAVRAVLVDSDHVVGLAKEELAKEELAKDAAEGAAVTVAPRLRFSSGNFIQGRGIPAGADTYMIKFVLNDWDDATVVRILSNVRTAMRPGARLLIIEQVQPNAGCGGGPFDRSALSDVDMLCLNGGAVRTHSEFEAAMTAAGFVLERVLDSTGITRVVVGKAVESPNFSDAGVATAVCPAVASFFSSS